MAKQSGAKAAPKMEYITAAEFGRWRTDFVAFRAELNIQLREGFTGLNERLDDINGRTRINSEGLVAVATRLDKVDTDDEDIDAIVRDIQRNGCAQLDKHAAVLEGADLSAPTNRWPRRKQAAVGGGLVAAGAGLWELIHAILEHFSMVAR